MSEQESLKQRLHRGDILIGVSVPMAIERSRLEHILGQDTYAFVTVDSQHSPYHEERLVAFCALAAEVGVPVQFRIKHTRHAYLIGNILDLGPLSIEVPLVEEPATVAGGSGGLLLSPGRETELGRRGALWRPGS